MITKNTHFSIESWNHSGFAAQGKADYHMVWGPFPIEGFESEVISKNLKKFDPNVKLLKYKHQNAEQPREKKPLIKEVEATI